MMISTNQSRRARSAVHQIVASLHNPLRLASPRGQLRNTSLAAEIESFFATSPFSAIAEQLVIENVAEIRRIQREMTADRLSMLSDAFPCTIYLV